MPNLFPNEDESTIQVNSGGHSWSFQSIPSRSNSVLLMHVGWGGEYEVFEHVQKVCVASTNKFHSCLCALKTCSYRVYRTSFVLYSGHSHCILRHSKCILRHSKCESSMYEARMSLDMSRIRLNDFEPYTNELEPSR